MGSRMLGILEGSFCVYVLQKPWMWVLQEDSQWVARK